MKSCSVPLKKLSEEEIQQKNCPPQQPVQLRNFSCSFELCQATFSRKSDLKKHSNEFHTGMNIFVKVENLYTECKFCLKTIFLSKDPTLHYATSPCLICKQVLPCKVLHHEHQKSCSSKCGVCGYKLRNWQKMETHLQRCQISRASGHVCYTCNFCSHEFNTKTLLKRHILALHLQFCPCNLCGQQISKDQLERHKNTRCLNISKNVDHTKKPVLFECIVCKHSDLTTNKIKHHIRIFHIKRPKNKTCSECSQKFLTKDNILAHYCPTRRKKLCSHCQQEMYSEFWLLHSVKEKCKSCNTFFPCSGLYLKHKIEQMTCHSCKMIFCDVNLLENHLAEIHNYKVSWQQLQFEELGQKCYQCKTYFEDKESLSQHTQNEHPLSFCDLCGTLCKNKDDLEKHLYTKHNFIRKGCVKNFKHVLFKCMVCYQTNMKTRELEYHLITFHPDYNLSPTLNFEYEVDNHTYSARRKRNYQKIEPIVNYYFCPISNCDFRRKKKSFVIQHTQKDHKLNALDDTCAYCQRVFGYYDLIDRKNHYCESRPKILCKFCNCSMYSEYLAWHQLVADCAKCNKKFLCENLLQKHCDEKYFCKECDQDFCELTSLIEHLKKKHNSKLKGNEFAQFKFPCFKCTSFFPSLSHLTLHQLEVHPEKIVCEFCGCHFESRNLKFHRENVHRVPQDFKYEVPLLCCKLCKMDFDKSEKLTIHIQQDHVKKTGIPINQHARVVTTKENTRQVRIVSFKYNCLRHKLIDTKIACKTRDFICGACGMEFDTKEIVDKHVMSEHHAKYRHHCLECNFHCISKNTLTLHLMYKHANTSQQDLEKPTKNVILDKIIEDRLRMNFSCSCGASFRAETQLTNHVYSSHMSNGVRCDFCTKLFTSYNLLKGHLNVWHKAKCTAMYKKIHFVDVEHVCSICGQRFGTIELLEEHSSIYHSDVKQSCKLCCETFDTDGDLKIHKKLVHGIEDSSSESLRSHFLCTICKEENVKFTAAEIHLILNHMSKNRIMESPSVLENNKSGIHPINRCERKCENCNLYFVNMINYIYHKKDQYKCSFCSVCYCDKDSFFRHIALRHRRTTEKAVRRIILDHNYFNFSRFSGKKPRILLTETDQVENEAENMEKDPFLNIEQNVEAEFSSGIITIKEEIFD